MHIPSLIEKKREGCVLSEPEISFLIDGFTDGSIPDYQMSAWAMAVYFQGMNAEETTALTQAMLASGDRMSYPAGAPRIVDKHSTGGIGDKVSLILAPLLACDQVWVPMISGRGLGITGGTLDKLESIPGFRVGLSEEEALRQLEEIGVAMMGQTASICPADKKLYALRDVTATVPSQPLIVASIMSKKLAESLDALVLDVKFGRGAFMKTRAEAESLGTAMCEVGRGMGVDTTAIYNPMDEPLGRAVGNVLEVIESIEVLRGDGPADLRTIVLDLAEVVSLVDRSQLEAWLDDGTAFAKFESLVAAQGGDPAALPDLASVHAASELCEILSPASGVVETVDADAVGRVCVALGAGRGRAEDSIAFAVGLDRIVKCAEKIQAGDCLGRIHASSKSDADAALTAFLEGVTIV